MHKYFSVILPNFPRLRKGVGMHITLRYENRLNQVSQCVEFLFQIENYIIIWCSDFWKLYRFEFTIISVTWTFYRNRQLYQYLMFRYLKTISFWLQHYQCNRVFFIKIDNYIRFFENLRSENYSDFEPRCYQCILVFLSLNKYFRLQGASSEKYI